MGFAKGEVDDFPVELLFRLATTTDIKQVSQQKQQVCLENLWHLFAPYSKASAAATHQALLTDSSGFIKAFAVLTEQSVGRLRMLLLKCMRGSTTRVQCVHIA